VPLKIALQLYFQTTNLTSSSSTLVEFACHLSSGHKKDVLFTADARQDFQMTTTRHRTQNIILDAQAMRRDSPTH
jgi:hypothetical protein